MSTVRDKIEDFEALNHSTDEGASIKKKRFALPSKDSKTKEHDQLPLIGGSRSKPTVLSGMEADLQDVWSVRKNIQHNSQNQKHKSGTATVAAAQYSRHGAIPAQPTQGPQIPKGTESTEKGHNSDSQPWSVRATNFSYSEAAKRPIESPNNDLTSPPLAKRKNIPDIIRPTNHFELPPLVKSKGNVPFLISTPSHHPPTSILLFLSLLSKMESSFSTFTDTSLHASVPSSDTQENNKKNYAKKMAQGYQRSVGMGEFTPKRDSYHPDTSSKTTKWKRRDSDEFDFET
eukprot:Em0023g428a